MISSLSIVYCINTSIRNHKYIFKYKLFADVLHSQLLILNQKAYDESHCTKKKTRTIEIML